MRALSLTSLTKLLITLASATLLQACTPSATGYSSNSISVEEAFLSSGVIQVKPYTRSIISSSNF